MKLISISAILWAMLLGLCMWMASPWAFFLTFGILGLVTLVGYMYQKFISPRPLN